MSCLPSPVNTTTRYLELHHLFQWSSTKRRVHCPGLLKRFNVSIFATLIFIPVLLHTASNLSSACWRPSSDDLSRSISSVKKRRLTLQSHDTAPPLSSQLPVIGGFIVYVVGFQKTCFLGSAVTFIGTISSYFVVKPFYLIFTLGIIQGIGFGLIYTSIMSVPSQYFTKNLGTANGVALCGSPLGSLIIPVIMNYLVEAYNIHGMFLILAGIELHMFVVSLLILEPPVHSDDINKVDRSFSKPEVQVKCVFNRDEGNRKSVQADRTDLGQTSVNESQSENTEFTSSALVLTVGETDLKLYTSENGQEGGLKNKLLLIYKNRYFIGIPLVFICIQVSVSVFNTTMPDIAINNGESQRDAALLITISSVCDIAARLSFGAFIDKGYINVGILYGIIIFSYGVITGLTGIFETSSYVILGVLSGLNGANHGALLVMLPVSISHYCSRLMMPIVLSICSLSAVVPLFCAAPLITLIFEQYGSYSVFYFAFSGFTLLISSLWLFIGIHSYMHTNSQII